MQPKLEKYLYKKYPKLFGNHSKSMQETCMCWGCSCGDGWIFLLDNLCAQITHYIDSQHEMVDYYDNIDKKNGKIGRRPLQYIEKVPQVAFDQVKEKFGALRIYYSGGDERISNMIAFVENQSPFICEKCGRFDDTVGKTTEGWISSSCEECNPPPRSGKWALFKCNHKLGKVLKKAMKDKEKNKGKEIKLAMDEVKKIRKRSKT